MLNFAREVANGFPIVRVDVYLVDNKLYFGEMTFTSYGGFMDYFTPSFLKDLGEKVNLP